MEENKQIISEMLNLERSLIKLKDLVENEFLFSTNDEAVKLYFAKRLIDSMIEIKCVLGEMI